MKLLIPSSLGDKRRTHLAELGLGLGVFGNRFVYGTNHIE